MLAHKVPAARTGWSLKGLTWDLLENHACTLSHKLKKIIHQKEEFSASLPPQNNQHLKPRIPANME